MLPIVAYTDKLTVAPGEALTVMASSFGARTYHADLRRIIQGDTNPEGPGYKDESPLIWGANVTPSPRRSSPARR